MGQAPSLPAADGRDRLAAALLFAAGFALYVVTLAPGLPHPGGDSHAFTNSAAMLELARRTGYPLWTWVAFLFTRLVPFGDVAWRTTLLSAAGAAGAVAVVFLIARRLRLGRGPAAFAALLLLTSTTLWSQAVVTEVYGPNAFMIALALWALLVWAARVERGAPSDGVLAGVALVVALSLGTHLSTLTLAPAYALFVLLVDPRVLLRPRALALVGAACLVGIAQFAWLPLRAETTFFPNPAPRTAAGVWAYTVGAFDNLRFTFPLSALPTRLAFYAHHLVENVTVAGVAAGAAGMWVLLWRQPAPACLLIAVYALNVATASQIMTGDAEVFFIPGYVVWVLFAGGGVQALYDGVRRLGPAGSLAPRLGAAALGALALGVLLPAVRASFAENDRRGDTVVGDFYRGVMDVLPPHSVLVAPPGVFGAAARYWAHLEGLRPDVRLPEGTGRSQIPRGAALFTTVPARDGEPLRDLAFARGRLRHAEWFVPVLLGGRRDLVLYRARSSPPSFTAPVPASARLDRALGATTLVAATAEQVAGDPVRVRLRTWWRLGAAEPPVVTTRAGGVIVEAHQLGFGMLDRVAAAQGRTFGPGHVVAEDVQIVLPSTLPAGAHSLALGAVHFPGGRVRVAWAEVGRVAVD